MDLFCCHSIWRGSQKPTGRGSFWQLECNRHRTVVAAVQRKTCLLRSLLLFILSPIFLSKQILCFSRKRLLRILQFSLFSNDNDPNVQILPFGYRNLSVRGETKPNVTTMAKATKTIWKSMVDSIYFFFLLRQVSPFITMVWSEFDSRWFLLASENDCLTFW